VVIDASGAAGNMRAAAASEPRVPRSMVENAMGKIENRSSTGDVITITKMQFIFASSTFGNTKSTEPNPVMP
jgi:hypothetical protein